MQAPPVTTAKIKLVGFQRVENLMPGTQTVVTVTMEPYQMTVCHIVNL